VLVSLVARSWLALGLAGAAVAAAGLLGRAHPLPDYGPGYAIIDAQMRRSHSIRPADVLVLGDSSALYGIDPRFLEAALGAGAVESLAAIGPARPPGFAKLLANYLARHPAPRLVLLVLHPLGLMHAVPPAKQTEMQAVLRDAWPIDPFAVGARKVLNRLLFGGLLEEPMPGEQGRHYGSAAVLAAALERGHGGLVHPARTPVRAPRGGPGAGMSYVLHADAVRDLRRMGEMLRALDTSTLHVGIAPIPGSLARGPEAASRRRLLARILVLLGLPPDRALDLPRSLPDALFVELTHLGDAGRRAYSRALVPILRARLAASAGG
jgi:hypothetical protein